MDLHLYKNLFLLPMLGILKYAVMLKRIILIYKMVKRFIKNHKIRFSVHETLEMSEN